MNGLDRRRFLASLGVAAAAASAGCSSDSLPGGTNGSTPTTTPTGTDVPEDPYVTDDAVVDYPGMVDGAATVNAGGDAYTIEYADPKREFLLDSGFEGGTDDAELRVSRDMSVGARAGFVAPLYNESAGEFVYQIFANEAFVEYADWNFVTVGDDGQPTTEGAVPFDRLQGSVYGAGVSPGEIRRLFVVDATAETLRSGDVGNLSGIVLLVGRSERQPAASVPQVRFAFEYAPDAGEVTITHEAGDNIPEEDDLFVETSDARGAWETPVSAGDARAVSVEPDATVRVVWVAESGDRSATLAEWTGPDA
ncbi:hypothetical protein [Natronomonas marina]|jgi:hypothetical protein|uniref:hypothetical protein n=1 Tax=Natronomonas marina TaxID=2961939 RepID=UPI0020C9A366|nr:hypothetical protein [Natronomonas marina]